MAKRIADEQITKDGFDGVDFDEDTPQVPQQASSDILSKRKILKPRSRLSGSTSGSTGFNGFSNITKPQPSSFSFGNGNATNTSTSTSIPIPETSTNPFGSLKQTIPSSSTNSSEEKNNKIRALNENFINIINKSNLPNTIADFTTVAQKYIDYYKSIQNSNQSTQSLPVQPQAPSSNTFQFKPTNPITTTTTATTTASAPAPVSTPSFSFKPVNAQKSEESKPTTTLFTTQKDETTSASKPIFAFNPPVSASSPSSIVTEGSNVSVTANVPLFSSKPLPSAESNTGKKDQPIEIDSESDDESDDEEKKETKVEGPKFTLAAKPTVKSSPFTFDPKKLAKKNAPDSDESEDEIEIKGPTFQFNKPIKDNVFKLKPTTETSKPFSFGENKKPEEEKEEEEEKVEKKDEQPKSTFNFKSSTETKDDSKPLFNFSKSVETSKPAFNFGSTFKPSDTKSAFSFGKPIETKDGGNPFIFGSEKSQDQSISNINENKSETIGTNVGNSSTPLFKFGSQTTNSTATTTTTTPMFNFKGPSSDSSVSKDTGSTEVKSGTAPSTSLFGGVGSGNSGFSFGNTNTSGVKPFTFGGSGSGAGEKKDDTSVPTPTFNFGTTSTSTATTSGFMFGNKKSEGESGNESNTSTFGSNKPTFGFSFGKTENKSQETTNETVTTNKDNNVQEVVVEEEEETGGNFIPIAKLSEEKIEQSNGEENESIKFTIRSKLMEFDSNNKENPYINKGLGELKILFNEITKKSRILIRADGSLRILLNTLILKSINYEKIGNGSLIRIPIIDTQDNSKIITYVVKVKTSQDGAELLKIINELK